MKKYLVIALSILSLTACKKREVDDVTIKYEVTISNPNRPVHIYYKNDTGDEDQDYITSTTTFTKSYVIKSDKAKDDFYVDFSCGSSYNSNTQSYESQTITVKLYEDDKVRDQDTWSGSAYLSSWHTYDTKEVADSLPSAIKYK